MPGQWHCSSIVYASSVYKCCKYHFLQLCIHRARKRMFLLYVNDLLPCRSLWYSICSQCRTDSVRPSGDFERKESTRMVGSHSHLACGARWSHSPIFDSRWLSNWSPNFCFPIYRMYSPIDQTRPYVYRVLFWETWMVIAMWHLLPDTLHHTVNTIYCSAFIYVKTYASCTPKQSIKTLSTHGSLLVLCYFATYCYHLNNYSVLVMWCWLTQNDWVRAQSCTCPYAWLGLVEMCCCLTGPYASLDFSSIAALIGIWSSFVLSLCLLAEISMLI